MLSLYKLWVKYRSSRTSTSMQNEKLWHAIQEHQFDDGFASRLAVELNWDLTFSKNAIAEYRRFVYLSQISKWSVTPSRTIDKVWHFHLTYTKNYWDILCKQVLLQPLHHNPGGSNENPDRFRVQFANTLALYQSEFGEAAPTKFWGPRPYSDVTDYFRKRMWMAALPAFFLFFWISPFFGFGFSMDGWTGAGIWVGYLGLILGSLRLHNWWTDSRKPNGDCGGKGVEYEISLTTENDGDGNADCGGGGCGD